MLDRRKFLLTTASLAIPVESTEATAQAEKERDLSPPDPDQVKRAREGIVPLEKRVDSVLDEYRKVRQEILKLLCDEPAVSRFPDPMTAQQKAYFDANWGWTDILVKEPGEASKYDDNDVVLMYEWFSETIDEWERNVRILNEILGRLKGDEKLRDELGKVEYDRTCAIS